MSVSVLDLTTTVHFFVTSILFYRASNHALSLRYHATSKVLTGGDRNDSLMDFEIIPYMVTQKH
jgi:hypothetical protein